MFYVYEFDEASSRVRIFDTLDGSLENHELKSLRADLKRTGIVVEGLTENAVTPLTARKASLLRRSELSQYGFSKDVKLFHWVGAEAGAILKYNGTLRVYGKGTMRNYNPSLRVDKSPWPLYSNLTKIVLDDGVQSVGNHSFEGCLNLREVRLSDSVKRIGYAAFSGCKNLSRVIVGSGLEVIEMFAFRDCKSLPEIVVPLGVQIDDYAFDGCKNLHII